VRGIEKMLRDKINYLLNYRNKKQSALQEPLGISSRQAINNKFRNNAVSVDDLIKMCDFLNLEIVIRDKEKNKDVITLDTDDLKDSK
jgi:hypothetical protein